MDLDIEIQFDNAIYQCIRYFIFILAIFAIIEYFLHFILKFKTLNFRKL